MRKEINGPSLFDTAKETIVFTAANAAIHVTVEKLGIPVTGADERTKKIIIEKPALFMLEAAVAAPLIEESIFRLAPNLLLNLLLKDGPKSERWGLGIPISLLFAYAHNFTDEGAEGKLKFDKGKFPLSHFIAGLYLWKMMRERGFLHAVIAHSTNNAAIIFATSLLSKLSPSK